MTTLDLTDLERQHGHRLVWARGEKRPAGVDVYVCVHRHQGCTARAHVQRGTDIVTWTHSVARSCVSQQPHQHKQQQQRKERLV